MESQWILGAGILSACLHCALVDNNHFEVLPNLKLFWLAYSSIQLIKKTYLVDLE